MGPLTVSEPDKTEEDDREGTRHRSQIASVWPSRVWRRFAGSCGPYASAEGEGSLHARIVESKEAEKMVERGEEIAREVMGPECVR